MVVDCMQKKKFLITGKQKWLVTGNFYTLNSLLVTTYKAPDQASRKEKVDVWDKVQELKKLIEMKLELFMKKKRRK